MAAEIIVERRMREVDFKKPKRYPRKKLSQYWQGYYEGLLFAHCQHALGFCPSHPENEPKIREALSVPNVEVTGDPLEAACDAGMFVV